MSDHTVVHLKGALEPVHLREPYEATMVNMSAHAAHNMKFFTGSTMDGEPVAISIDQVLYLVNKSEA
jgi:hypothetical protein